MAGSSPAMTSCLYGAGRLPRRHTLHGRLPLGIRDPHVHAAAAIVAGIHRELAAFEQRLQAAIDEFLGRRAAVKLCRELDDERGLQRAVEHEPRIALDLGDVIAVVMDAVTVEG